MDLSGSKKKSWRFEKDQRKFLSCNKLIARGQPQSSTNAYAVAAGAACNVGSYDASDVVGISAEGVRKHRRPADVWEIQKAVAAAATIITDTPEDRARPYNRGERDVAEYLEFKGYAEVSPGTWNPKT